MQIAFLQENKKSKKTVKCLTKKNSPKQENTYNLSEILNQQFVAVSHSIERGEHSQVVLINFGILRL